MTEAKKKSLFLSFATLLAIVFLPTTMLLTVGMLPTLALAAVDKTRGKAKTLSVGAMNFAGCVPFILDVWVQGHGMEYALDVLMKPQTVVIMYFAAVIGYLIEWSMTGITVSVMAEQGKSRLKQIEKVKQELIERWGQEVTNTIPLDADDFPMTNKKTDES